MFVDIFIALLALSVILNCGQLGGMFFINVLICVALSVSLSYFCLTPIAGMYLKLGVQSKWPLMMLTVINSAILYSIFSKIIYVKTKRVGLLDSLLGVGFGGLFSITVIYILYAFLKYIVCESKINLPRHVYILYTEAQSETPVNQSDEVKSMRSTIFFALVRFFECSLMKNTTEHIFLSIDTRFEPEISYLSKLVEKQGTLIEYWRTKLSGASLIQASDTTEKPE